MAYSVDLRKAVVAAFEAKRGGMRELAVMFGVGLGAVNDWVQRAKRGESLDPQHGGGKPRLVKLDQEPLVLELLAERADWTLNELRAELRARHGLALSETCMWRTLGRMGVSSKKKSLHAAERQRPDVVRARRSFRLGRWFQRAPQLVFVDESGINLSMTRLQGWGPVGERVIGAVPKNWGDNLTLVAALGLRGVLAPLLLRGSMDGDSFATWVEQFLAPELVPGDRVLMDGLSSHKHIRVRNLIEVRGAKVRILPPYSYDYSPIEYAWSKVKNEIRKAAARGWDDMVEAACKAFRAICPRDIYAWFARCGYCVDFIG